MRAAQLPSGDGGGGGGGDARPDGSKGRDGAFKGYYVRGKDMANRVLLRRRPDLCVK